MKIARAACFSALAAIAGCDRAAIQPVDTTHPSPALIATAPPAPAPLACLAPDSLRSPSDTLHYSGLHVHEETGDLLGTDLQLVRQGPNWAGRIALAEGGLSDYAATREVNLNAKTGAISLTWDFDERLASFHGTLTCSAVSGEFRWGPDAEPVTDTLPRWRKALSIAPAR